MRKMKTQTSYVSSEQPDTLFLNSVCAPFTKTKKK